MNSPNRKGFTLIELLVSIVLSAILSLLAMNLWLGLQSTLHHKRNNGLDAHGYRTMALAFDARLAKGGGLLELGPQRVIWESSAFGFDTLEIRSDTLWLNHHKLFSRKVLKLNIMAWGDSIGFDDLDANYSGHLDAKESQRVQHFQIDLVLDSLPALLFHKQVRCPAKQR